MDNIGQKKGRNINFDEIKDVFIGDFIKEILDTLDSIELELVNLEVDPENIEYLNTVGHRFHTIKGLTGFLHEKLALHLTEETELLIETCRKFNITVTRNIINIVLQTSLFLRKMCNNSNIATDTKFKGEVAQHISYIKQLSEEVMLDIRQPIRSPESKIGEILLEEGSIKQQDIYEVLEKQSDVYKKRKFGEIVIMEKKADAGELIKAIRMQKIRNESIEQYVKIPIEQLDMILEMTNRLGTIQKKIFHEISLESGKHEKISAEIENAEQISSDIQKILGELRLVTLQQSFRKLTRAVKAMIEDAGLHVVFSTMGENTELSKEVAEDIVVPLAEIIGFMLSVFSTESNDKKAKLGSIEVVAYKQDEFVVIEIINSIAFSEYKGSINELKGVRAKIERLNGIIEFVNTENKGCKAKIILHPHQ